MNKKLFLIIVTLLFFINSASSYTLDVSVDNDIKSNYTKTEISSQTKTTPPKGNLIYSQSQEEKPTIISQQNQGNKTGVKIPSGTKFCLKNNQKITDYLNVGAQLTFVSCAPLVKKNITIPSGTKFTGIVTEKHSPQIAGNGALIGIKISSMIYNNTNYPLNGKLTKVNANNVFFNNIKGERQYIKGIKNQVNKGRNFQQKARKTSSDWAKKPVIKIVSGLPKAVGGVGKAIAVVSSPFAAIANKGGHVDIPAGTILEIKLLDNVYVSK